MSKPFVYFTASIEPVESVLDVPSEVQSTIDEFEARLADLGWQLLIEEQFHDPFDIQGQSLTDQFYDFLEKKIGLNDDQIRAVIEFQPNQ